MSSPTYHAAVQVAVAAAPWWADTIKLSAGSAIGGTFGLLGTMLGLSHARRLQRERFDREDAGARTRVLSALEDLQLVVETAVEGNFVPDAWKDRLQRLMRALDDERTATALSQAVYARTLKAASYAEHILAWLQLPETQVLTDAEIKRVAQMSSRRRNLENFYRDAAHERRREAVQSYSSSVSEDLQDAIAALEHFNRQASKGSSTSTEWRQTDTGIFVKSPSPEPVAPSLQERLSHALSAFRARK